MCRFRRQKLQDLTKENLEANYRQKDYSHSTVNALGVQMKNGVLAKNPHNGAELNKLRPLKKISAHTSTDQEKIIDYCKFGGSSYRIYYFLISTGMCFGETAALIK